jgi:Rieske Fe-S protein
MSEHTSQIASARRQFFVRCIQAIQGAMGATLAFVVGRAVIAPAATRRETLWLHAGSVNALGEDTPTPVTLRIARPDGASEVVDRRVVYLVRSVDGVRALDSTCTHLGCRTRYNAENNRIECPCHGGVYDTNGHVVEGPPPHPLATLNTRVEGDRVLVEV